MRRQERTAREEPFGASTPSSKRLIKRSSTPEAQSRQGGAKPGHDGHGRSSACAADADVVELLDAPACCPDCGATLEPWGERTRTVYDCEPVRRKTRLIRIAESHCGCCGKTFRSNPPDVLPRSSCSNRLVAQAAAWHYVEQAIKLCVAQPASHPSVQHIQNIFREHRTHRNHWAFMPTGVR